MNANTPANAAPPSNSAPAAEMVKEVITDYDEWLAEKDYREMLRTPLEGESAAEPVA